MDTGRGNNKVSFTELLAASPFAGMLAALCAGIAAGAAGVPMEAALAMLAFGAVCEAALALTGRSRIQARMSSRPLRRLPLLIIFAAVGTGAWVLETPPTSLPSGAEAMYAVARVDENAAGPSGDRLLASVLFFESASGKVRSVGSPVKVELYTSEATELKPGDVVRFRNRLEPADSAAGLKRISSPQFQRGVAWRQYLAPGKFEPTGHSPTLATRLCTMHDRTVLFIERTPLSRDTRGFLEAVALGDRGQLDMETREMFSQAGVAHLLALSGMHLGIVAMIVSVCLFPFTAFLRGKWRLWTLLAAIWGFTLLTGMGVSVVRAAIMMTMVLLARILERKRSGLNAICAAAFFILFFDPLALFSPGFQLSFITCGALIALGSRIRRGNRLAAVCGVSVAAFMSSWMLTAFYFHNIPLLFLPANIVAGAAVTLILAVAAVWFPLFAAGLPSGLLGDCLDMLCRGLGEWCVWIDRWQPCVDHVYMPACAPWIYLFSLLLLGLWLRLRGRGWLWGAVAAMGACCVVLLLGPSYMPGERLRIGLRKGETVVTLYGAEGGRTELSYPRGCVSESKVCGRRVIMADCDYPLSETGMPRRCDLLIIGAGCGSGMQRWMESVSAPRIALGAWIDENRRRTLDSVAASRGAVLTCLSDGDLTLKEIGTLY